MTADTVSDARPGVPAFATTGPKKLYLNGKWVEPRSGAYADSIDPTTEQPLTAIPVAGPEDIDAAVAAARQAFPSWSGVAPYERTTLLLRIADLVEAHSDELARLESADMGGPIGLTTWMVAHSVEVLRHYAGWPTKIYGQTAPSSPGMHAYVVRQPIGVVATITAWNGPLLQLVWKVAPALATGNTVVAKPALWSSLTALRFAELLDEAGVPPGVVNIVTGDGGVTGEALIRHPGVDKISFTGSVAVGKHIMETASRDLKRVTLELGGKSPTIVFADADLAAAAQGAALGFTAGSGEGCVAGSRIFVEESVKDEFRALLLEQMKACTLGDPLDPATTMGPLAARQHHERVTAYFEVAEQEGGSVVRVTEAPRGLFVPATLIEGLSNASRIAQEEIFGPVAALLTFTTEDEVIRLGNDTVYGLSASLWTRDLSRAHRIAAAIEAGTIWVNTYGVMSAGTVPFGGFKQSGIGREHGTQVLDAYTETKTVMVQL
ncbi:aldehyde dehydrogenase family protein [Amycolatopsis jejuensis]|uniref:aldehyde dehydrogenase family protein n=1 Tax=Amycolatopsis jejuensis TaxID=330084 RepID=UPI00052591F7|nr:aldehyde dehydrogenase family protein [Amycolatopsis jejuensis]